MAQPPSVQAWPSQMGAATILLVVALVIGLPRLLVVDDSPTIHLPASAPTILLLGDDSFKVELGIRPIELWERPIWFENLACVRQVTIDGTTCLGPKGMPDKYVLRPNVRSKTAGALVIGVGWKGIKGSQTGQQILPVDIWIRGSRITVEHRSAIIDGAGYRYRKIFHIKAKSRQIDIEYEIENLGQQELRFTTFNHNWLCFGAAPVGPSYHLHTDLPFTGKAWIDGTAPHWQISKTISGPDICRQAGPGPEGPHTLRLEDRQTRRGLAISGSFPVSAFSIYADAEGICPEIFTDGHLAAGETWTKRRSYRWYTLPD